MLYTKGKSEKKFIKLMTIKKGKYCKEYFPFIMDSILIKISINCKILILYTIIIPLKFLFLQVKKK